MGTLVACISSEKVPAQQIKNFSAGSLFLFSSVFWFKANLFHWIVTGLEYFYSQFSWKM